VGDVLVALAVKEQVMSYNQQPSNGNYNNVPPVPQAPSTWQQPQETGNYGSTWQAPPPLGTDPYAAPQQQWYPPQQVQPEPPKKKSRKGLVIAAVVVGVLGIGGIINALGGGEENPVVAVPTTTEPAPEPTTDAEPAAEETEEPEPTEEPTTEEPEPEAPLGTVENPGIIGENFTTLDYTDSEHQGATLVSRPIEVDWDATSEILAENMFNDEPEAGFKYVMVTVQFEYTGKGAVDPFFEVSVEWLKDGRTYDDIWEVLPNDATEIGDLYDGGVATGTFAAMLPEDADASNTLIGLGDNGWSTPLWFKAP